MEELLNRPYFIHRLSSVFYGLSVIFMLSQPLLSKPQKKIKQEILREEQCGPAFKKVDISMLSPLDRRYFTESAPLGFFLCQLKEEFVQKKKCNGEKWQIKPYLDFIEYECQSSDRTDSVVDSVCEAPYVKKKERKEKDKSVVVCFLQEEESRICQGGSLRGAPVMLKQTEDIHSAYVCYFK